MFTYYADTAYYLADTLRQLIDNDPRLAPYRNRWANVSDTEERSRAALIAGFAPQTAGTGEEEDIYDLLITTDVLAEGVNLQQAANIVNYDLPWNPMKLTQRHGRIDRIGSLHERVYVRCFFPDVGLDRILGLEARLQRKLKQAAAAVGIGHVLPGIDPVERSITETRERIDQLRAEESDLFDEAGSAALSGEEYRRRLTLAFKYAPTKSRILALPWGAGTGLERPGADPGFVFCAKVADWPKPVYRYIPLNADLSIQVVPTGDLDESNRPTFAPNIIRDTLSSLSAADPGSAEMPASAVSAELFAAAFEAWEVARADIHAGWIYRTDPANLVPQLAKTMRDAAAFIEAHGAFLGEQQDVLAARFRGQYPRRIQREVRSALSPADEPTPREIVDRLGAVADQFGLAVSEPPQPLPWASLEDIHLICWVAIHSADESAIGSDVSAQNAGTTQA